MRAVFLLCLAAFGYAAPIQDAELLANQFGSYLVSFNKTHTAETYPNALNAFTASLQQIKADNELEGSEVYGLTKFSDMPAAEFAARYLTYKPSNETTDFPILDASEEEMAAAPKSVDWRKKGKVTPVKVKPRPTRQKPFRTVKSTIVLRQRRMSLPCVMF